MIDYMKHAVQDILKMLNISPPMAERIFLTGTQSNEVVLFMSVKKT